MEKLALEMVSDGVMLIENYAITYLNNAFREKFVRYFGNGSKISLDFELPDSKRTFYSLLLECEEEHATIRVTEDCYKQPLDVFISEHSKGCFCIILQVKERFLDMDLSSWKTAFGSDSLVLLVEYHKDIQDVKVLAGNGDSLRLLSDDFPEDDHYIGKYMGRDLGVNDGFLGTLTKTCEKSVFDKWNVQKIPLQKKIRGKTVMMETVVRFVEYSIDHYPVFIHFTQDKSTTFMLERLLEQFKAFSDLAPFYMGICEIIRLPNGLNDIIYRYANQTVYKLYNEGPGVSISCIEHGVNASIIDEWVDAYELSREKLVPIGREQRITFGNTSLWVNYHILAVDENEFIFLSNDITNLKHLEEELKENARELERKVDERTRELRDALEVKSRFLAVMSHEIRTPLTGIKGALTLFDDLDLSMEHKEMLHISSVCCEHLLTIINDCLDFSKIEAGKMELESAEFDMVQVIEDAMDVISFSAQKKGIELISNMDSSIFYNYMGDATRFRQILVNLLSNAVKFSSEGEIVLSAVVAEALPNNYKQLLISVQDKGIGITESAKSLIFNPFSQADTSITRKYGGSGLGLSITKKLVELMHGRIWFDSQEGHGTTFHFTVHLQQKSAILFEPEVTHEHQGSYVVVEPNKALLYVLKKSIEHFGYKAAGFVSVEEMLEGVSEPPKSILLAERLQRTSIKQRWTDVPIVGMGSITGQNAFDRYLTKPIKLKALFNILTEKRLQSPTGNTPTCYRKDVPLLLAEDNHMNQIVIKKLLQTIGFQNLDIVDNGRKAVEAVKAKHYDIVLMDIMMPEMGGKQATEQIRREESIDQPIILALTADVFKEDREQYLASGMNEVISKPIDRVELLRTMKKYLRK